MNPKLLIVKSWSIMLAVAFLLIFSASFSSRPFGTDPGDEAPKFRLEKDGQTLTLSEMQGKHVLVNFWSAACPESRIDNVRYSEIAATLPADKFVYIGINIDSDASLAKQILKVDGVRDDDQFFSIGNSNAAVVNAYSVENGNRAFLINPEGMIEAVSPDESSLMQLI